SEQVQFAQTIHQSGADLLALINEILDLAKIESGTIALNLEDVRLDVLREYVERSFRHLAEDKGLQLGIEIAEGLPETVATDDMRLRQVLRNLLSNALKFTEQGSVTLRIAPVVDRRGLPSSLHDAEQLIALSVSDTG